MEFEFIARLVLAGVLGALIGFERERRYKEAGLRTHFLVAVGSALIMIISKYAFNDILHHDKVELDPSRVAAQVVSGVGFLGAGTILVQRASVRGLTTAAGLWATSAVGLSVGAGLYLVGVLGALLVLLGLEVLNLLFRSVLPNKTYKLTVSAYSNEITSQIIDILTADNLTVTEYQVNLKQVENETLYVMNFQLKPEKAIQENQITKDLQNLPHIESIKFK
ncbi:putative Mg2+ transporter-C (MgtC) family protein [Scopulibacillus daqui]|uniref:Mg2+ transporter-C (MgtC) family protein n=1 Tax=Scopulibacillus daqui TaxID=1469162 RepID=A0ABS2Q1U7_9BACL|nr:MgtC/SapB family protein [Scopulibacillus daqui]MBM7646257.1 putative Mg2+ transporter-C (MgtC) family protein [Scopulibacillus daqui]